MKSNLLISALMIIFAMFTLTVTPAKAAVTAVGVTEIDAAKFESLMISGGPSSFSVKIQGGGLSGQDLNTASEIIFTVGGTKTYGQHTWSYPEPIEVSYGSQGNVYAMAGSDIFSASMTPTLSFNTILVRVADLGTPFGDVTFENGIYVVDNVKLADIPNTAINEGSVYYMIDLGETNPVFEINGRFDATMAGTDRGFIEFTAINIIPEIGSTALFIFAVPLLCLTRRR